MTRLPNAVPKPKKRRKKPRKPIRRSRVRQKAGKPKRFAKRRDDFYRGWVREQPCAVGERDGLFKFCRGVVQPAHVQSRGAGGYDKNNLVPLCEAAHQEQHQKGIRWFAEEYFGSLENLKALAQQYTERYDRERSVG